MVSLGLHCKKSYVALDQNIYLCNSSVYSVVYMMICCASVRCSAHDQWVLGQYTFVVPHFRVIYVTHNHREAICISCMSPKAYIWKVCGKLKLLPLCRSNYCSNFPSFVLNTCV